MALTPEQRYYYEKNMQKMREEGFFLPTPRSLAGNTRYLIISTGGTGADGLFAVKKAFEQTLSKKELQERVRFLAIDTDRDAQKKTKQIKNPDGTSAVVEVDAFTDAQFFQLSGTAARFLINQPNLDPNLAQWMDPKLLEEIRRDACYSYLSGYGASGVRQLGRLMLYPASTANGLTARISTLVAELTDHTVCELQVFLIAGIAGGTGSGTVVDLSYFIRDVISDVIHDHLKNHVHYGGFILLPPTGKAWDPDRIRHGNVNGYAALKEINHFMTLQGRDDTYSFTYGNGRTVVSKEPIFDACYLLDGSCNGVAFANPREQACKVLAQSILDMATSGQTCHGMEIPSVHSFMSGRSILVARNAAQVYCTLGHDEFAMPANEIKAYVCQQIFDKIYAQFKKCADVGQDDVRVFVADVIKRGVFTAKEVKKAMDAEINSYFTDRTYGPFYTINLLAEVGSEVDRLKVKIKLFRPGMVSDESLDLIAAYALKCNRETYIAYTCAMEGLKNLMDSQINAVVTTVQGTRQYSFIPGYLGNAARTRYVIEYLDGLIDPAAVRQMCDVLLAEMIDNKDNWVALIQTDLGAKHDAPAAMRKFWEENLDRLVTATMEDLLIKFYSGDSKAHYSAEDHAATRQYLQAAARAIYDEMLGIGARSEPLLQLSGGLTPSDFIGYTCLMVPACAPHLYEELACYAMMQAQDVQVCQSTAQDRISCYKQYCALPAFKLSWAIEAKRDYEMHLATDWSCGLHLFDTADMYME